MTVKTQALPQPTGSVTLVDEESGTWIALPTGLPDEAWLLLPEVSLKELPSGSLRWDPKMGRWRDAWDED